jgi:transposase
MRLTQKSRRARKRLLELLSEGCSISQACAAVGIGRRTFYVWLQNDADFASAVDCAHTRLIAAAERTLLHAIEHGDTRAAMWLLERLAPRIPFTARECAERGLSRTTASNWKWWTRPK